MAELLDIVQGEVVPGQVEQAVEQGRAVAGREDETVPAGPSRVGRIVAQEAVPQGVGHGRGAQGHAGVAAVGLLDHVRGKHADGVYAQLVKVGVWIGHEWAPLREKGRVLVVAVNSHAPVAGILPTRGHPCNPQM